MSSPRFDADRRFDVPLGAPSSYPSTHHSPRTHSPTRRAIGSAGLGSRDDGWLEKLALQNYELSRRVADAERRIVELRASLEVVAGEKQMVAHDLDQARKRTEALESAEVTLQGRATVRDSKLRRLATEFDLLRGSHQTLEGNLVESMQETTRQRAAAEHFAGLLQQTRTYLCAYTTMATQGRFSADRLQTYVCGGKSVEGEVRGATTEETRGIGARSGRGGRNAEEEEERQRQS